MFLYSFSQQFLMSVATTYLNRWEPSFFFSTHSLQVEIQSQIVPLFEALDVLKVTKRNLNTARGFSVSQSGFSTQNSNVSEPFDVWFPIY